ncbi:MAG TPA: AAA family ATPase, partial [Streptosporangiaceae bacterium]|nr:AAA family ATPase [Streptosporangiaceae bacterium]
MNQRQPEAGPSAASHSGLGSPDRVVQGLRSVGYLPNERIASVVYLGEQLAKPVLVEGPAGTGKTELAKSVALMSGMRLIRLQCYEGLDESKAIYEWDYRRQLLQLQLHKETGTTNL